MDIENIKVAATEFRVAIEKCKSQLGITFRNFPRGSCGDAAPLLGTYLIENGFGEFQYYLGDYGDRDEGTWSSHAWLQAGDIVVDITADQFDDISEKVIVEIDSKWHKKLNGKPQNPGDYRVYDVRTVATLGNMYKVIKDHM